MMKFIYLETGLNRTYIGSTFL